MSADADHDGACDEVSCGHLCVLLIEVVVDNKAEKPGYAARDVEQRDWTLKRIPLDRVSDFIRLFRSA